MEAISHRTLSPATGPVGLAIGLTVSVLLASCGGSPGKGTGGASPKGPVVAGERLTPRAIIDRQQGGIPVGVVAVPESWKFDSEVTWDYAHHSNPVLVSSHAQNPVNSEAVFGFPPAMYFSLRPAASYYRPGQNYGGLIFMPPQPPLQALARVVQQIRGGSPKFQWVGSKDLPDLPAALNMPASPGQHGLAVKVSYELSGQPVEEEFYAVTYSVDVPYDGPQGRTYQINWGLNALHSFRGPAGSLDKRRPVFAAIAKSFRPNPAWQQRLAAVNKYLADEFNRQLQAGYDQIAAAARLSRAISANNDAMLAAIDRSLQSSSAASSAEARSAASKFDDYVRGVETVDDPYYGTSQHAATEQFHWTDGYGNYRNTNDVTYDPNRTEVGNWQLMKPIR